MKRKKINVFLFLGLMAMFSLEVMAQSSNPVTYEHQCYASKSGNIEDYNIFPESIVPQAESNFFETTVKIEQNEGTVTVDLTHFPDAKLDNCGNKKFTDMVSLKQKRVAGVNYLFFSLVHDLDKKDDIKKCFDALKSYQASEDDALVNKSLKIELTESGPVQFISHVDFNESSENPIGMTNSDKCFVVNKKLDDFMTSEDEFSQKLAELEGQLSDEGEDCIDCQEGFSDLLKEYQNIISTEQLQGLKNKMLQLKVATLTEKIKEAHNGDGELSAEDLRNLGEYLKSLEEQIKEVLASKKEPLEKVNHLKQIIGEFDNLGDLSPLFLKQIEKSGAKPFALYAVIARTLTGFYDRELNEKTPFQKLYAAAKTQAKKGLKKKVNDAHDLYLVKNGNNKPLRKKLDQLRGYYATAVSAQEALQNCSECSEKDRKNLLKKYREAQRGAKRGEKSLALFLKKSKVSGDRLTEVQDVLADIKSEVASSGAEQTNYPASANPYLNNYNPYTSLLPASAYTHYGYQANYPQQSFSPYPYSGNFTSPGNMSNYNSLSPSVGVYGSTNQSNGFYSGYYGNNQNPYGIFYPPSQLLMGPSIPPFYSGMSAYGQFPLMPGAYPHTTLTPQDG